MILVILALAFALRIIAIHFGLPHLYHADEPIIVNHALAYGTGDFNPHFFKIPPLVSYLLFSAYGFYFLIGKSAGRFQSLEDFEHLFYADPSSFYLLGRILFGALLGTLTVYGLYRVIHRSFGKEKAWLSAFFLAVCFLHVRDSHYIYADIPLVLILVAGFGVFFHLIDEPDKMRFHMAAGIVIGLAAATKYNGIALAIPYAFASLIATGKRKWLGFGAVAAFAAAMTYFLLNPYSLLDAGFFLQEIRQQAKSNTGVGWLHHFQYSLAGALGWPLLAASIAGLGSFLMRNQPALLRHKKMLISVFILSYYLVLVLQGQPYERYVLPLVPFVLFFAADILADIAKKGRIPGVLFVLIAAGLALPALIQSVLFDRLMLAPDTRTLAKQWIEKNIPVNTSLALDLEFYAPRLRFSQAQLEQKKETVSKGNHFSKAQERKLGFLLSQTDAPAYELYFLVNDKEAGERRFLFSTPALPFRYDDIKKQGIQYAVVVRLWEKDVNQSFYDDLDKNAELVAEFNPYRDVSRLWPYTHPLTGGPFLFKDILERERNGQPIKIYKLSETKA